MSRCSPPKPGGAIPTTVIGRPPTASELPITAGSPSKTRRHSDSAMTTTGAAPGRPSAGVNKRPRIGDVPSVAKKSRETKAARALAASPRRVTGTIRSPCAAKPAVRPAAAVASASNSAGVSCPGWPVHRTRTRLARSTTPGTSLKSRTFSPENMAPQTAIPIPSETMTVATCAGDRSNCRQVVRNSLIGSSAGGLGRVPAAVDVDRLAGDVAVARQHHAPPRPPRRRRRSGRPESAPASLSGSTVTIAVSISAGAIALAVMPSFARCAA